jgi:hypothetical protein
LCEYDVNRDGFEVSLLIELINEYKLLIDIMIQLSCSAMKLKLCCDMCATCDGSCEIFACSGPNISLVERPGRQVIFCYGLVLS